MAIQIEELKLPITPEDARSILQRQTDQFGVFFDLDRVLEYESNYSVDMFRLYPAWRRLAGQPNLEITKNLDILHIVMDRFKVPEYKLKNKDKKTSIDSYVRENLMNDSSLNEDALEFIRLTHELSKLRYYRSYLQQYKNCPLSDALSYEGHRMTIGHPQWELLSTSRISAKDPSVQNIAKDLPDIITQPKGWILVRADSGQIEPRIMWSYFMRDELMVNLITAYNDAYYGYYDYIKMDKETEMILRADFTTHFTKKEITEDIKEKRQSLKTLALAGSYGSQNLQNVDPTLSRAYTEKIVNHPARLAWEDRVKEQVSRGIETFHGAFGTPVTPDETDRYARNAPGWSGHLIRCGINNPVQTTASELMLFSILYASRILNKSKDSHIAYYKHDEGAFYVREDEQELVDELAQVNAYDVKGWIPVGSEVIIGKKINKDVPTIL